jgi:hypothetical protein
MDAPIKADDGSCRAWRWGHLVLLLAVLASWLLLSALNLWMGELNQDEGWYLYAAKQMTAGKMPYRDFAFTQPPMLPLVYSWAFNWVGRLGLLGGRVLTWLFSALGLLSAVWLAMRAGPRRAQRLTAGLCFILIAINLYQSYFTTVVKTYALAGMFLCSGLAMLSFVGRHKGFRAAAGAGFLLACAAATRISLGAALALGGLYLLICRRRLKAWVWLDYGLGGLLGLALTLLPFMAMGQEGFRFGIWEYHSLREAGPWLSQLAYKVGCLSRLAQAYFPAAISGLGLLIMACRHVSRCGAPIEGTAPADADSVPDDIAPCFAAFLWVSVLALGLVHLAAPFPYDDYQVPVYPVYCAVLAATGARWWLRVESRRFGNCTATSRSARRLAILTVTWLVCGLHAFSSPLAQNWFVAGRDRIWWRLRKQSPMAQLQDMAKWVRDLTVAESGTELLTQDIYLAVQADLPVPHGLEMGPFSYYPDWSRERAERIGVMNREMMIEMLATNTNAPIAALSGYSLSIRSPEVEEISREDQMAFADALQARFERVESVPGFGQAGTTLEIWRLKSLPEVYMTPPAGTDEE